MPYFHNRFMFSFEKLLPMPYVISTQHYHSLILYFYCMLSPPALLTTLCHPNFHGCVMFPPHCRIACLHNCALFPDAENNRLQVETPQDNMDSAPNSSHLDAGDQRSVQGEASIFDLTKNSKSSAPPDNKDSSGYSR